MTELSKALQNRISEHQETLLVATQRFFGRERIPKAIRQAFLDTPRHAFARRFYSAAKRSWIELEPANLSEHLAELYSDHPISIYRDKDARTLSTISQPSLVLYMLDLLELEKGMSVFELGGGSGWNAAMLGRLVGPEGSVSSFEIIPELAESAKAAIDSLGLSQVKIIAGDGSMGDPCLETYDRGVFTASAWELPSCFFEQIKTDGLLLLVVKVLPNCDLLAVLRKHASGHFISTLHFACSFVPLTGSRSVPENDPVTPSELGFASPDLAQDWNDLNLQGEAIPEFIDFARIVFDCQIPYLVENPTRGFAEEYSGFHDSDAKSLALFNEDSILAYGTDATIVSLRRAAKRWLKAGSPTLEELALSIHPASQALEISNDQWLVRRGDSQMLWSVSN